MAEKPIAQWPVILDQKCELCETNNIMFKCLNCDEMMCDTCKKSHLRSKLSKDHKMVNLKSAEIYENNQMGNKCPSHKKEDLLMYCNTCNCPVCRECVTSGVHLNHPMVKVEEVIDTKQKQLSNIIRQTNKKSKRYKDVIKTITQNKLEFSESITKKIKEVKANNSQLKSRLDKMESELIQQLQSIDKENKKAMTDLEQRLQEEMSDINQLIEQCERKQKERNIEMVKFVTDVTQRLDKYRSCDPPDPVHPPDLITKQIDDQELKVLLGHLDMKTMPKLDQPLSMKTTPKLNQPLPMKKTIPSASPVMNASIINSFDSERSHVVTTGDDQAWLWSHIYKGLSLVTSDGKVIQDINTDFGVSDAAVSMSGDLLVTERNGNKVKKLTRHNTFTDIYTAAGGYDTRGITVTDTGNVLVALYKFYDSKIVEITTTGQHIRTIQHDTVDNKPLFNNPWFICTNINGDIVVIDYGYNIVVINQQGQKRFTYKAEGRQLQKSFNPDYIVTDKQGHIIISDISNSVLHVLDKDGKFLQYLITPEHECYRPGGLALDNHGRLWVCNYGTEKVIILKYV